MPNKITGNNAKETVLKEKQLKYFSYDVELAAEYSIYNGCESTDSGYHCSCYDIRGECCQCEKKKGAI